MIPGGHWVEGGDWAFNLLRSDGLEPTDHVLDVGCGSLATGVHLLAFLEPGRYFGFEANQALVLAGVSLELPRVARDPRARYLSSSTTISICQLSATPIQFAISDGLFFTALAESHRPVHCGGDETAGARRSTTMRHGSTTPTPARSNQSTGQVCDLLRRRALPLSVRDTRPGLRRDRRSRRTA